MAGEVGGLFGFGGVTIIVSSLLGHLLGHITVVGVGTKGMIRICSICFQICMGLGIYVWLVFVLFVKSPK